MDSVNSFKGYGKVDPVEEAAFKRKTRKRVVVLAFSLILLVALIVGIVVGVVVHGKSNSSSGGVSGGGVSPATAIRSICSLTVYPDSCLASLKSSNTSEPEKIFGLSLSVLLASLQKVSSIPDEYANRTDDPMVKAALTVCGTALNDAIESLNDSISAVGEDVFTTARIDDLKTWLSTVMTDQETCIDALGEANATFTNEIMLLMRNSTEFASNSLAIVSKVLSLFGNYKIPSNRRLLAADDSAAGFPSWMSAADRRLLQESPPKPDMTVAKDGSGDETTISAAVARIPNMSNKRFVIYVKAGVYEENVALTKSQWNVMIYGDGQAATNVSGNKSHVGGTPTFFTATFAVVGKGFIARDITFTNTAGPEQDQAVAFRSGSDQSVFYRCSFDAFQDTLYAHSNRQFYRECDIYGTIDFIFGNSAAVFQKCNILPHQPLPERNQIVTITAQGKTDPNQNTGISIQRCTLSPSGNLSAQSYLGRPWKAYSTTVIMESAIGGFLNPAGWAQWVTGTDPPNTIFYAENQNTGAGSNTAGRVKWAGYKSSLTTAQASNFNVQNFIQGTTWLPATAVVFDST